METKVNEEYQKLINIVTELRMEVIPNTSTDVKLQALEKGLMALGTRPLLSNGVQKFIDITNSMAKTYAAKNHDYGNSFEQSLDKFGLVASIVRIGDKMNRIESLSKKEAEVKDESIKDTLLDLASYSIMTVMWLNSQSKEE